MNVKYRPVGGARLRVENIHYELGQEDLVVRPSYLLQYLDILKANSDIPRSPSSTE